MKKVVESSSSSELMEIIEVPHKMNFNISLLSCEKYVVERLKSLDEDKIKSLRGLFSRYRHPRLTKALGVSNPYCEKQIYVEMLGKTDVKKLAKLIKICGILAQTKVYLFYQQKDSCQ
ncbi:MAG: hypothetical protein QXH24_04085 [Candidatus Bathyarchaeia archaeon]